MVDRVRKHGFSSRTRIRIRCRQTGFKSLAKQAVATRSGTSVGTNHIGTKLPSCHSMLAQKRLITASFHGCQFSARALPCANRDKCIRMGDPACAARIEPSGFSMPVGSEGPSVQKSNNPHTCCWRSCWTWNSSWCFSDASAPSNRSTNNCRPGRFLFSSKMAISVEVHHAFFVAHRPQCISSIAEIHTDECGVGHSPK